MQFDSTSKEPIYIQLRERLSELISTGRYQENQALPSVRTLSIELGINHITVSKALQGLVDDGIVEQRRGIGMFVSQGASARLLERYKDNFEARDLPAFQHKMALLGLNWDDVIALSVKGGSNG